MIEPLMCGPWAPAAAPALRVARGSDGAGSVPALMRRLAALCLALVAICLPIALRATDASAKSSRFLFGIIPQQTLDAHDFESMHTAGARSLRIALYWAQVEPWPGARDWSQSDAVVAEAASNGVSVLPYVYGSPPWSATADGYGCTSDCVIYAPSSDASRARFAGFAADAVRRYGRDGSFWEANPELPYRPIRTWQVWNEQNTSKYFAPAPDAERYAALLVAAADAIRSVDRRADVALGGMWGPKGANAVVPVASYLKLLYPIPGVRESFDSLSVHPYGKNADDVVEQVREVRRVAASFHDRKASILATELGWASTGPADHWLVKGRRGQARLLRNSYEALLERQERWRIRGAWWYTWQDNPPEAEFICRWCPGAGLVGVDGRRKPAWRAMKKLAARERDERGK